MTAEQLLAKWLELGERTLRDHIWQLDANRAADFAQGVRETKQFMAERETAQ